MTALIDSGDELLSVKLALLSEQFKLLSRRIAKLERKRPRRNAKEERNSELVHAYRAGTSTSVLAEQYGISRQRVSQILRASGEDPAWNLQRYQAARSEAARQARMISCRVCNRRFERFGNLITCSEDRRRAWYLGRRYLDPTAYEQHRRYVHAESPPNRRYAQPNSAVVRALIAVGRSDVLPAGRQKRSARPPCTATNRDGTPCSRHCGIDDDELCHIHRAMNDGYRINLRSSEAS